MVCLFCHHPTTRVTNSRSSKQSPRVWRRRECQQCLATVTTYETLATQELPRVHSGDHISSYSIWRLMISIVDALGENKPDCGDIAHALAETITQKILATHQDGLLTTTTIAIVTHETLTAYDRRTGMLYALKHDLLLS